MFKLFIHFQSHRLKWIDDKVVKFKICYHQWKFFERQNIQDKSEVLTTVGVTILGYISLVAFNVIFKILFKLWSRAKSKENIYEEFAILLLFYSILVQKHRACMLTCKPTWMERMPK